MPRVPTEKDFEILLQDAEKSGVLDDVVKEKKELVNNPLSYLRFDPSMNIAFKLKEELDPEFAKKRQLFLQKNPEFAEFIKGLEGLSKFQRRRKIRNYLKSNPELANQIKEQMRNRKASSDGDSNQDIFNDRKGFGGRRGFMRMFR